MKPKHVHRGLTNKSPVITDRDDSTAGVGKLQRIHRTFQDGRTRGRRSPRDKSAYFRSNLGFFFLIVAVAFIGVVTWMLYQQMKSKDGPKNISTLAQDTFVVPHPSSQSCINLVKRFLQSGNSAELLKSARLKRIPAEDAYAIFSEIRKELGEALNFQLSVASETNGLSLEQVNVYFPSGHSRVASLIHTGNGEWKVDLESFIAHNTKPWQQITSRASCTAVVRVQVKRDFYFNGYFSNEKEWVCFALKSPLHGEQLFAYLPVNSPVLLDVIEIMSSGYGNEMMLEITRDAGMDPMQFEIRSVIAQGWVESDSPFSGRKRKKAAPAASAQ